MKVYVVTRQEPQWSEVVGVFSCMDSAKEAASEYMRKSGEPVLEDLVDSGNVRMGTRQLYVSEHIVVTEWPQTLLTGALAGARWPCRRLQYDAQLKRVAQFEHRVLSPAEQAKIYRAVAQVLNRLDGQITVAEAMECLPSKLLAVRRFGRKGIQQLREACEQAKTRATG